MPVNAHRTATGLLGWVLRPLLFIADDFVEAHRRDDAEGKPALLGYGSPTTLANGPSTDGMGLQRRQAIVYRGNGFVQLGMAFEKMPGSGYYVVTHIAQTGIVFGKLRVGDLIESIDGVPLRHKKLAEVVGLLAGDAGTRILFELVSSEKQAAGKEDALLAGSLGRLLEKASPKPGASPGAQKKSYGYLPPQDEATQESRSDVSSRASPVAKVSNSLSPNMGYVSPQLEERRTSQSEAAYSSPKERGSPHRELQMPKSSSPGRW
jgi:hypothetical protein